MYRSTGYLLQQPSKTLQMLAMESLAGHIALIAEELSTTPVLLDRDESNTESRLTETIETVKNFLESNVPKKFFDPLALEIQQAITKVCKKHNMCMTYGDVWNDDQILVRPILPSYYRGIALGKMIQVMFSRKLSNLALYFDDLPENSFTALSPKFSQITGLVKLHIHSVENNVNEHGICVLIKQCEHKLKDLSVQVKLAHTESMLVHISNCKLLEQLDLKDNYSLNDDNINLLSQLKKLQSVNIENTAVAGRGIATLLLQSLNIEHLYTSSRASPWDDELVCDKIADALYHIHSFEKFAGSLFKLKSYENAEGTVLRKLRLVLKMCPHIETMSLVKLNEGQSNLAHAINSMQNLRDLKLNNYDFISDHIKETINVQGCNIVNLEFSTMNEIDLNALMYIVEKCPNLQRLNLNNCYFQKDIAVTEVCRRETTNIRSLILGSSSMEGPTSDQLFFLLSKCPNVEYIYSGVNVILTDALMLKVLAVNPMKYLTKLIMIFSKLTTLTLDKFRENCTNKPEVIIE